MFIFSLHLLGHNKNTWTDGMMGVMGVQTQSSEVSHVSHQVVVVGFPSRTLKIALKTDLHL